MPPERRPLPQATTEVIIPCQLDSSGRSRSLRRAPFRVTSRYFRMRSLGATRSGWAKKPESRKAMVRPGLGRGRSRASAPPWAGWAPARALHRDLVCAHVGERRPEASGAAAAQAARSRASPACSRPPAARGRARGPGGETRSDLAAASGGRPGSRTRPFRSACDSCARGAGLGRHREKHQTTCRPRGGQTMIAGRDVLPRVPAARRGSWPLSRCWWPRSPAPLLAAGYYAIPRAGLVRRSTSSSRATSRSRPTRRWGFVPYPQRGQASGATRGPASPI